MRPYVIVGAGAIGGTLGHHLARAGHPVTVVDADPEHVRRIGADGLVVVRGAERSAARVARALTPDPDERALRLERVLLAVKAQATGPALDWIAPRLADDGFVVSLQNGLNEDAIARRIGRDRTVGAFVNLFADVIGPGEIRDGGPGALVVGELDGRDSRRVREVVDDLQAWGPARATGNVAGYLWSKLGFGAMLVATALADAPMAELIDRHRRGDARAGRGGLRGRRGGGGHAGALRRVRPAALRGRRRRREASGPPTRSSPGCARRRRTAAASGATSRSGAGPPRSPPTTARCSPPPRGTASRCPAWSGWSPRSASWSPVRRWTRPASPPSPERCGDRGAAAVRGRRRRRRRAAPVARRTGAGSSWTTSSPTPSWRRRATTSRC